MVLPITTDFNLHCLPGFDFYNDYESAVRVLDTISGCYIKTAVLTPSYDSNRYTPTEFRYAIDSSISKLLKLSKSNIELIAAPVVELSCITELQNDLKNLAVGETDFIYISLPAHFDGDIFDRQLHHLLYKTHLKPIFCNFDIYCVIYDESQLYKIISTPNSAFQFNMSSLKNPPILKYIKAISKISKPILFGSGIENYSISSPNYHFPKHETETIFGKAGFYIYLKKSDAFLR